MLGHMAVEGIFSPSFSVDFTETGDVLVLPPDGCGPMAACSSHLVLPCGEAVSQLNDSPVV